jgi:hypothetical protein
VNPEPADEHRESAQVAALYALDTRAKERFHDVRVTGRRSADEHADPDHVRT